MPAVNKLSDTHTLSEFLSLASSIPEKFDHRTFCMIETRDGLEYPIYNVIDDYLPELKAKALTINLSSTEREKYIYNPKLLSYKIYNTTMWYYIILRLNNLCNAHEFTIPNNKLLLIPVKDLKDSLSKIFNSNSSSIKQYNTIHSKDVSPEVITIKY